MSSSLPKLKLKGFPLGPYETNCYILWREGSANCWIIDAGYQPGALIAAVKDLKLTPTHLLLTHAHCDHIAGISEVLAAFQPRPKLLIHAVESEWLNNPTLNLSEFSGQPITAPGADAFLTPGQTLTLDGLDFQVRHTPGHSPGSVSFYCAQAGVVISGDALFAGSIGRTDFPGSDHATLERAIRTQLYTLPQETRVFPGHGPPTTVGREMISNPYVRA